MNTNETKIPTPEEQEETLRNIEMLKAFDFDSKWLENSVNQSRYLIKGKGICILEESGEIRWYEIIDDRYDLFGWGIVIDDEELHSTEYLNERENALIASIMKNDQLFQNYNLNLITISEDGQDWYFIEPISRAIFKTDFKNLEYIDTGIDERLRDFAENDITTAHEITFHDDGTLFARVGEYIVQDGRTDVIMCDQITQEELEGILSGKYSENLDEILIED